MEFPITSNAANVTATVELLCAARAAGVRRVVYAASSSAYGDRTAPGAKGRDRVIVKSEAMPPRPLSPYAVSKLAGEYYAQVFHDVYGVDRAIVVTQDYHLRRMLFSCDAAGIDVVGVGVSATSATPKDWVVWHLRELPASWKGFVDAAVRRPPATAATAVAPTG